jgi:hypothetical protein
MSESKTKLTKVSLSGADTVLWEKMKPKLLIALDKFLDTVINYDTGASIKQEAQEFTSAMIKYGKAKLEKASIENDKLNAEIEEIYTRIKKDKAETRKINAVADRINFDNQIRALKVSLGGAKALMIGSRNEEDILLVKRLDAFFDVINEFKYSNEEIE